MINFFLRLKSEIEKHIKSRSVAIILCFICLILGIVLGIVAVNSKMNFYSVFTKSNKLIFDFISGKANPFEIFFSNFFLEVLMFLIIFVFGLSIFSWWLSLIFLAFQGFVFVLACSTIIELYSIAGALNVIFLALPVNVIWFVSIISAITVNEGRAYEAHIYNQNFGQSFKTYGFIKKYLFCFIINQIACLVFSFVFALILRNFLLIAY